MTSRVHFMKTLHWTIFELYPESLFWIKMIVLIRQAMEAQHLADPFWCSRKTKKKGQQQGSSEKTKTFLPATTLKQQFVLWPFLEEIQTAFKEQK